MTGTLFGRFIRKKPLKCAHLDKKVNHSPQITILSNELYHLVAQWNSGYNWANYEDDTRDWHRF